MVRIATARRTRPRSRWSISCRCVSGDAPRAADRARSLAQVMSIMESKEAAKARKALAESAREKVTTAVDNFRRAGEKPKVELRSVAEKVKVNEAAPDKKAADKAVAAAEFQTLEELLMERRLLMRLGCYDDARRLDKRIDDARARREADRVETNKRVLEKKLAGLEMKQRVQRQQLLRRQAEELTEMQEAGAAELKNLMTLHAQEYHALYEQVTQAAAFEENAHMSDIGVSSRASRTIAKQRYRMSKELLNLRESVAKLNESGRDAQATEVLNTIREREHAEKSAWRDEFLKLALGAHDGSVLSQMLLGHKTAQAKLADKNERALVAARRAQVRARTRQEGTFRLEKWKVIDLCRKQGTAAYMAYRDDDGALGDDWKRKNMKVVEDDLEHGGVGQVIAARDDGTVWVAPTAFGLNNSDAIEYRDTLTVTEGAAQLNSLSAEDGMFRTLTKLFWLSEANSTLTALLLNTDATTYFRDFLSDEAPNFMVDLRFVLEVHGTCARTRASSEAADARSALARPLGAAQPPSCTDAWSCTHSRISTPPCAYRAPRSPRSCQGPRARRAVHADVRALLPEERPHRRPHARHGDEVRKLGVPPADRQAGARLLRAVRRLGDVRSAPRADGAQVVRIQRRAAAQGPAVGRALHHRAHAQPRAPAHGERAGARLADLVGE